MFRIRISQSVRDLFIGLIYVLPINALVFLYRTAIICTMVKLTIRTKFKTSMLLLAVTLHNKNPTQVTHYNTQLDFARAQAEASRLNH